jgi:ATP-dependent Lhr-like helicase
VIANGRPGGWTPRRHPARHAPRRARGPQRAAGRGHGCGEDPAGFLPSLCELIDAPPEASQGLHTLYISPLKALAVDVQRNLLGPIEEMGLPIKVETRTGDTPSDRKARQRHRRRTCC